VVLMMIL